MAFEGLDGRAAFVADAFWQNPKTSKGSSARFVRHPAETQLRVHKQPSRYDSTRAGLRK